MRSLLGKVYSKVEESEKQPSKAWYLPHFPILRPDRATTKTRIVFDAAAKDNGIYLKVRNYKETYSTF